MANISKQNTALNLENPLKEDIKHLKVEEKHRSEMNSEKIRENEVIGEKEKFEGSFTP